MYSPHKSGCVARPFLQFFHLCDSIQYHMENEPIIKISNLSKSYGKVHALENVSFDVKKGVILGLLGPNGAGKTTLVNILTTLLKPDTGTAEVAGFDVLKNSQA